MCSDYSAPFEPRLRIIMMRRAWPIERPFALGSARKQTRGGECRCPREFDSEMAAVIPTERNLVGIISELRRLNRTITVPLERDLKRAGCPPLETYEVLRAIEESGDVRLGQVELQTRLAVPRNRMSRLINRLVREGYVERGKAASDQRGRFVVITDLGRRASRDASSVLLAALRQFFYGKKRP
jgi:DNA-binding MarR family transcriptional regulator